MVDSIIVPRRRQDFFDEQGDPTLRFIRWIELVTGQTNQTVIDVIDTGSEVTSSASRISRDAAKINDLDLKQFEIVNTILSLTTNRNQRIICKNTAPITITLDPLAVSGDEVMIKRRGEVVTVIGFIDGTNDRIINVLNWNAYYIFDGIDWSSM